MIELTCPKTGGVIGVHPNHIASVAPDRMYQKGEGTLPTRIYMKGGNGYVVVSETSRQVLDAIAEAKQTKGGPNE